MRSAPSRSSPPTIWIVLAVACLFFGSILGYVIATSTGAGGMAASPGAAPAAPPPAAVAGTPPPAFVDERQLRTYREILARDPGNIQAATALADMLYDAARYAEAVPIYRQAFALASTNVGISTDLGTSLWYSGQPDEALAQYEKSLALEPTHAQTLFNRGIVLLDGKGDRDGAIASWEKLLATNPAYADASRVRQLIEQARARR